MPARNDRKDKTLTLNNKQLTILEGEDQTASETNIHFAHRLICLADGESEMSFLIATKYGCVHIYYMYMYKEVKHQQRKRKRKGEKQKQNF